MICKYIKSKTSNGVKNFYFEIVDSINLVSKNDWNKIADKKYFLHADYLAALEKSGAAGISFRYATVFENKIPVAICYFQLADLSSKEFGSLIDFENYGHVISTVGNKINQLLFSGNRYTSNCLLVCGSLFVSGEYGIACKNENLFPSVINLVAEMMLQISNQISETKGRVVCFSVKDFYQNLDKQSNDLLKNRFHKMVIDPNMIVDIKNEWKKFDDYLNAMSSKYRLRANNVIKKTETLQIKYLEVDEIVHEKDQIENLYLQVQKKAPVKIIRVNSSYFQTLKENLKNNFVFRAFYLNGKMIAFTSGFKFDHQYEAHFIGLDYHLNKSYALYQNILYDFVNEAIKNKSTQLVFGRTAMEIKSTVGATAHSLTAYLKISNTILNRMIKHFIPAQENKNWIARSPFKE